MNDSPFRTGDFVWTNFPEREDPRRPGPQHVSYTLLVSGAPGGAFSVMAAYTSSKQWTDTLPFGVHRFDKQQAERLGHSKAFILDLRTVAWIPVTSAWFPRLDSEKRGVLGHAPKDLRTLLEDEAKQLFGPRNELLDRRGPLWPR